MPNTFDSYTLYKLNNRRHASSANSPSPLVFPRCDGSVTCTAEFVSDNYSSAALNHSLDYASFLTTCRMQVRNKWLRILETSGGRSGSMTGAAGPYRGAYPADGTTHGSQAGSYGNSTASTRGRGRGRGSQRGRGGGRGGNRVVPRQATPPALVS